MLSYSVPVFVTIAFLGCIEIALRVLNRTLSNPFTTVIAADSVSWYQVNRNYLRKYFPANISLLPELKPSLLKTRKEAKLLRIICLGESSMFGTPYQMTCTIPAILRKQLTHLFPGYEFEVLNLGASAINSNVIVDLSKQVIAYEPDLVLLYMGHNDFYGPDGIGASFFQNHFPSTIQWVYQLRDFRIVRLIEELLPISSSNAHLDAESNLMKQVSQGNRVPLHSPMSDRIFKLFEHNLRAIIRIFHDRGIPLIVGDVTSNLDFPPFLSDSIPGVESMGQFEAEVKTKFSHGSYRSLEEQLLGCLHRDSTNALINYWLGKVYLVQRKFEPAKFYLLCARDHDLLKFRAPSVINSIIHRVGEEHHVPVVSIDSLFAACSSSGIPGSDLFWEHLHPNPFGYYLIANAFLQKILDLHLVPTERHLHQAGHNLPFEYDSLSICWHELAYGDLSIKHLTTQWPFTNYSATSLVYDTSEVELQQIAQGTYNRKIKWEDGCYKSAEYFWKNKRMRAARTTYEALIDDNSANYYAEYLLGNLLLQISEKTAAKTHLEISIHLNPRYPQPRLDLGLLRINEGKFDDAIRELSAALDLAKDGRQAGIIANIKYGLATAYANKGEFERSLQYIDESIKLAPNYPDALSLRTIILDQMQKHR